jgi:putative ATP-dependent endonuclease of OLD family
MRICRIEIENFRNFEHVNVQVGTDLVVVGENGVGKSNLMFALRLLLDPSLPDSARRLRHEDFWDGLPRPLKQSDRILISIDLTDFEGEEMQLASLAEHIVEPEPMVARLTYLWKPLDTVTEPSKDSDYEFVIFGGDRIENEVGYGIRSRLPIDVLPALRDAEADLARWTRSPLRPLLTRVNASIDHERLETLGAEIEQATAKLADTPEVSALVETINDRLTKMAGLAGKLDARLRFSPSDPDKLIRALRVYIDDGLRGMSEASLGAANILYLTLKTIEYENLAVEGTREHTFLGIEEPEAHLHPQLQRTVYRSYLKGRVGAPPVLPGSTTVILTTHSPHITSVAPIRTLVLIRNTAGASRITTTATLDVTDREARDLERYLDVTRSEILFARGVLLVEGDAERYLLPVLASKQAIDLDGLGISLCAVGSTEFRPLIKLLGPKGLDIPFAILTDRDPTASGTALGEQRVTTQILPVLADQFGIQVPALAAAATHGVFLNSHTLEVDLMRSGFANVMSEVMQELTTNHAAHERMATAAQNPDNADVVAILKDIRAIGKGRFAQRLASVIDESADAAVPPDPIAKALAYIFTRVSAE